MYNYYPNYPTPNNDIVWVQGESGAKSFMVAPNKSVLLMDSEAQRFYIKTSDASGMPLPLRVFDYTEVSDTPQEVSRSEYESLSARIEELEKTIKKPRVKKEDTENA